MRYDELILYKHLEHGEILKKMSHIMECCLDDSMEADTRELRSELYDCMNGLAELAGRYGFQGNLWYNYLTLLLVNNENAFSTVCEIVGAVEGSITEIALHDYKIFKEYFDFHLEEIASLLNVEPMDAFTNYYSVNENSKVYNQRIRDRICDLSIRLSKAEDEFDFMDIMTGFYKDFGVGKLGLHKAFRVAHTDQGVEIIPITKIAHVHLDDLVGYETAKKKLIDNTEAFVEGRRANNCLLFGDAGTGKSSSIKAILNQYYDKGLRMIEIYKHQFQDLNDVIAQIKDRNYKFIIYMDDLSFEEFEIEYKYLKAVIEGGLERKPDNILIYATSNRRHLVREEFADKAGRRDDLHASDTVQEKLSLVARFGVQIFFCGPSQKEYQNIVLKLAERNKIEISQEDLFLKANQWALYHGGPSGRTAQQFIDHLLGCGE